MAEEIDLRKLVISPFTGLYWIKTLMYIFGFTVILFIGYAVYKAYIKKPEPSQAVHADAGSNVTLIQNNQRKRMFIPFIEGYVEQQKSDTLQTGLRAGCRVEF